jgi:hypothetical protein
MCRPLGQLALLATEPRLLAIGAYPVALGAATEVPAGLRGGGLGSVEMLDAVQEV